MRSIQLVALPVLILLSSFSLSAQVIAKDHVSDSSLWNEVGLISCFGLTGLAMDFEASSFVGNGERITRVGMIVSNHINGIPNPVNWFGYYVYDVRFYQDIAALQGDPINPTLEVTFDAPSNLGYDVPVGTYTNGLGNVFDLHYIEFDVAADAFETTLGVEHFVAMLPREAIYTPATGITTIAFSNNGSGAIGGGVSDYYFNSFGIPYISGFMSSLGWPAYDHVAHLIELAEPAARWTDLGGGTTGIAGQPTLVGTGTLLGGTPTSLSLTNAPTSAAMLAWVSFAPAPFAALGGTVHAHPFVSQLLLFSDASGEFSVSTAWPAGLPPGTEVTFQFLVDDLSSIHGITLSNGLLATTP